MSTEFMTPEGSIWVSSGSMHALNREWYQVMLDSNPPELAAEEAVRDWFAKVHKWSRGGYYGYADPAVLTGDFPPFDTILGIKYFARCHRALVDDLADADQEPSIWSKLLDNIATAISTLLQNAASDDELRMGSKVREQRTREDLARKYGTDH